MRPPAALPSVALGDGVLAAAGDELVESLRSLIRIASINPVPADAPDGETRVARWIAGALADAGLEPEILEMVRGRGSVVARLRGDGSGGEPLLLLSHLDVVPAAADLWTHGPFDGDVADGYIWGRGAVDMKNLLAMELTVIRMLAAESRAAGLDPAVDPIPGLTRDVLFASTADEEATAVTRLAVRGGPRPTGVMQTFLGGVADELEGESARLLRALASDDPRLGEAALAAICEPVPARVIRALLRDTVSPNIVHA